ncbi:MAG: BON domain-containing protein [Acidimicrobiales bacterium]
MPDEYLSERIRDALAHDDRVAELGISVSVSGDRVFLTGDVATDERKAAVAEVVRPLLEGRSLHNAVTVASLSEPEGREQIP